MRMLLDHEAAALKRVGNASTRTDRKAGIERHDRLYVMVYRQAADQAERLSVGRQGCRDQAEIVFVASQSGKKSLGGHTSILGFNRAKRNDHVARAPSPFAIARSTPRRLPG